MSERSSVVGLCEILEKIVTLDERHYLGRETDLTRRAGGTSVRVQGKFRYTFRRKETRQKGLEDYLRFKVKVLEKSVDNRKEVPLM